MQKEEIENMEREIRRLKLERDEMWNVAKPFWKFVKKEHKMKRGKETRRAKPRPRKGQLKCKRPQ